eukprot:TRINITY_DN38247_c0_g1_i1.p1 TRINITY_DN38247_c0_g1~~TRINITY_DN38247_c0_g1_i1.p1  ORF type:complete len:580 (+),score=78.24 TRINITY_DN38247_c0_g1_i1:50-1789(+)
MRTTLHHGASLAQRRLLRVHSGKLLQHTRLRSPLLVCRDSKVLLPRLIAPNRVGRYFSDSAGIAVKSSPKDVRQWLTNSDSIIHPQNAHHLICTLQLGQFTEADIDEAFDRIDTDGSGLLSKSNVIALFEEFGRERHLPACEVTKMSEAFISLWDDDKSGQISKDEFRKHVLELGNQVHPVIYQVAGCLFFMCLPAGILVPFEPQLVQSLGITAGEFGMAQGMLFLSKFLTNIPITDVVDRAGTKPLLLGSTCVLGTSIGLLSLVSSLEQLLLCRCLGGAALAGIFAAVQAESLKVQTPLNRARSGAPLTQAVNAGFAMGPALGGVLSGYMTMEAAFAGVGVGFFIAAGAASKVYVESSPPTGSKIANPFDLFGKAFGSWRDVLQRCPEVRYLCAMQVVTMGAVAGTSMTLMPLLLSAEPLSFSAPSIGALAASVATLGVVVTKPLATFADKYGRGNALMIGAFGMSVSMATVPLVGTPALVSGAIAATAVGQNLTTPAISTLVIEIVAKKDPRLLSQAMSLLRSLSDVGMVTGAAAIGALGGHAGFTAGYELSSAMVLSTAIFTFLRLPSPAAVKMSK